MSAYSGWDVQETAVGLRLERAGVVLWRGDSVAIVPQLETEADCLITDPPYGIVNKFGTQERLDGTRRLQFSWDTPTITADVLEVVAGCLRLVHRRGSAFVFCGFDQFGSVLECVRDSGMTAKAAAWRKTCPPPACPGNWWPSAFEIAAYGYRTGAHFGDDDPKRCNVFDCDTYRHGQPGKVDHETQKPLKLMRRIVGALLPDGGLCIDPFMGSGTTGIAVVERAGRFIGIEKRPDYFDLCVERITAAILAEKSSLFPATKPPQQVELF